MSSSFNRFLISVISFSVYLLLKRTGKTLLTAVAFVPVVLRLHNISIWFVKVVSVKMLGICPVCDWTNSAVPDCTIMAFSCSNSICAVSDCTNLSVIYFLIVAANVSEEYSS